MLGVNSAFFQRKRDAVDRQHVRRDAVIHAVSFGVAHHFVETVLHHVLQAFVHFAFAPEKSLAVLHPLEIADRDAAGIGQNVRE